MKAVIHFFTSMKLTLACLGCAIVLVFVGTLAQVRMGIYGAQSHFFQSFFVTWQPEGTGYTIPVFPGGYLLGTLLLINLISSHLYRFRLTVSKSGIWLIHGGLILLLTSGLFTDLFSVESQMVLDIGQTKNYSEDSRRTELAVIDTTDPHFDDVVSFPEALVASSSSLSHPRLPFTIQVRSFWPNSRLFMRPADAPAEVVFQDIGSRINVAPAPLATKPEERNLVTAAVELTKDGKSLGNWLLSNGLAKPQKVTVDGHTYRLEIRPRRYYKPYAVKLLNFTHEKYAGTDIPKNFASKIALSNPEKHEDREVLIYMNNPLRYSGETYYQASFANDDKTSILEVVRNPNWRLPYISCLIIGLGLLTQFSMHLVSFLRRRT